MRIAVIGSGISGLGAAWALLPAPRGHAVRGRRAARRTRQHRGGRGPRPRRARRHRLHRLQRAELPEPRAAVRRARRRDRAERHVVLGLDRTTGRSSTARGRSGLLAQPSNLLRPSYLRMVREIVRFSREAKALVGGNLRRVHGRVARTRRRTRRRSATTSCCRWWRASGRRTCARCSPTRRRRWPASSTTTACSTSATGPQWRTVTGGSREYVRPGRGDVRRRPHRDARSISVARDPTRRWSATPRGRTERFDHVVLATHADTRSAMLGDDATAERATSAGVVPLPGEPGGAPPRPGLHADGGAEPGRAGTTSRGASAAGPATEGAASRSPTG